MNYKLKNFIAARSWHRDVTRGEMELVKIITAVGTVFGILNVSLIAILVWLIKSIFTHRQNISTLAKDSSQFKKDIVDHEQRISCIEKSQAQTESAQKRIEGLERRLSNHETKLDKALRKLDRNVSLILKHLKIEPAKSLIEDDDK